MDASHDFRESYCRKLGHYLTFGYCRTENSGLPCGRILDCWFEKLPVGDFLRENYTPEEIGRVTGPAPPKTATLVDLIERARGRARPAAKDNQEKTDPT
jgi:hypothetical protein